ncbi:hypothetical protein EJ05DRAFT_496956 [Pseudovirgaria hyperparasitica]|uniref:Uncharacterized protein n=1 Tax=Pseudovirgaria hyperparasitica TaxID=470096 RepID=A0A6A6WH05_9PEZI|nr:uncharacterized protein EJ05DRAFT_496956 [Pseudovirgaria hyperparasitica]KAF2762083.1 hypothetical protein EJ05DRAFT_496956 [Pseudovirgaria hyperparasitica]
MSSTRGLVQFVIVAFIGAATGTAIFKPAFEEQQKRKFDRVEGTQASVSVPADGSKTPLSPQQYPIADTEYRASKSTVQSNPPSLWNALGGWAWSDQGREESRKVREHKEQILPPSQVSMGDANGNRDQ